MGSQKQHKNNSSEQQKQLQIINSNIKTAAEKSKPNLQNYIRKPPIDQSLIEQPKTQTLNSTKTKPKEEESSSIQKVIQTRIPSTSPFKGSQQIQNQIQVKSRTQFIKTEDKLKNEISTPHLQSRNKNIQIGAEMSIPFSSLSSQYSPSIENREINFKNTNLIQSVNQSCKSLLGQSTSSLENPKFIDFIKNTTGKPSQTDFSKILLHNQSNVGINPIIENLTQNEEEQNKTGSSNFLYQKWLQITGKAKKRESQCSTERGEKPSLKNRPPSGLNMTNKENNQSMSDDGMLSEECDEKRSFTPEPKQQNNLINVKSQNQLNKSAIGLAKDVSQTSINFVYKTQNMEISKYISMNKSNLDNGNQNNNFKIEERKALIESKGSKCVCHKSQRFQNKNQQEIQIIDMNQIKSQKCGNFCKNLTQQEQKRIILNCLKKDIESIDSKQNSKVKKYLIDSKWWRKWCDYVNFDTRNLSNITLEVIENQLEEMNNAKRDSRVSRTYDSSTLYCKPERIINQSLLDPNEKGSQIKLRQNLIEHFDFEQISPNVWQHLYSWYSADYQLVRYLKKDKFNNQSFILDLYPQSKLNQSFIGGAQESSGSDSDQKSNDSSPQQLRSRTQNATPVPSYPQQSQQTIGKQNKTSFFGLSIPGRQKLSNKSQDLFNE